MTAAELEALVMRMRKQEAAAAANTLPTAPNDTVAHILMHRAQHPRRVKLTKMSAKAARHGLLCMPEKLDDRVLTLASDATRVAHLALKEATKHTRK